MDQDDGDVVAVNSRLLPDIVEQQQNAPDAQCIHPSEALSSRSKIRIQLYTSHFLSTWNSRVFEFGAFLFLAAIYPQDLLPASVYALTRSASAVIWSRVLGQWVDKRDRLVIVRFSIIGQRLAVALSCVLLFCLNHFAVLWLGKYLANVTFGLLCILACIEKLSSVLNTISVERDWVVVIAEHDTDQLRVMNSQMRRIDLFCKLMGPLFISLITGASTEAGIICTGAMTAGSAFIEFYTIKNVFHAVPSLAVKQMQTPVLTDRPRKTWSNAARAYFSDFNRYIRHDAFLPSFSISLLYLTVLSFGGQMITYLLAIGLSSPLVGPLRGCAAIVELSATWIAPQVIRRIGAVRAGIWFLNWQIICVAIACLFFWSEIDPKLEAAGTVCAVIFSRLGLWGFDLSAQLIIQEEVETELCGTFSSQEFALKNAFEMLAYASTIVFAKPQDFKYPATVSAAAVATAGIFYATFVRSRRGHLLHISRCVQRERKSDQEQGYERLRDAQQS